MATVAKIGDKEFESLISACASSVSGDTLTLVDDETTDTTLEILEKSLTLNLNGHSFTSSRDSAVIVSKKASLTVTDTSDTASGKIVASKGNGIVVGTSDYPEGSSLEFNAGTIESQEVGIVFLGDSKVVVNGGKIYSKDNAALSGNGSQSFSQYAYDVTVNGGELIAGTQTAGYANSAVYAPNNGTVTINGGNITSEKGAGIVVRAGKVKVNGGTINALGTDVSGLRMGDANPTYCGGVEVCNASNYPGKMGVTSINGGTITSKSNAAALVIGNPSDSANASNSKLVITDGKFEGTEPIDYVDKSGKEIEDTSTSGVSVSGGTFSKAPTKFVDSSKLTTSFDENGNEVYEVLDSLQTVSKNVKKLTQASEVRDETLTNIYNRLNKDFDQDTDNSENISKILSTSQDISKTGSDVLTQTQSIKSTVESINKFTESLDKSTDNIDSTTGKTYQDVEEIKATTNKLLTELTELNSGMIQLLDLNQQTFTEVAKLLGDDVTLNTSKSKTLKQIYEEQITYHINQAKAAGETSFIWNHTMNDTVKEIFEAKGCKLTQPESLGGMYLVTLGQ